MVIWIFGIGSNRADVVFESEFGERAKALGCSYRGSTTP